MFHRTGLVTNKVYADGQGPRYEYEANGRLTKRTWARGVETFYAYDGWGNLTNTTYSNNTPTIALRYDAMGRQVEAHDAAGVTTFAYDDYGANTNETVIGVAGTNMIERFYDEYGRNAGYALNGNRQTTLAYDPVTGRIATMLANGSDVPFAWNYLPGSDLKSSLAYPNGLSASWTYDANAQLFQVCNATPTNVISQYDYTYDAAGRRVACGKSGSAFAQNDTLSYGYNEKSELTNAVAAVDSDYRYSYDFDEIGNRESSVERGTNSVYVANNLNQYTSVDDFTPLFDPDGNQTLVKTATGIWQMTYNGENRPILWTCGETNIVMSYDRMGRRVTKSAECGVQSVECCRFVYDGYLQIANHCTTTTTSNYNYQSTPTPSTYTSFIWDPTEPVATRPLAWFNSALDTPHSALYYTHDGNKNVSEVIASNTDVAAHYEYAPFGALTVSRVTSAATNPWRFSSEYAEDDTATVYYNYRHYEPVTGRWLQRDPISEAFELNVYLYCGNDMFIDLLGLLSFDDFKGTPDNDSPHDAKLYWTLTSDSGEIKVEMKVRYTDSQCEDAIRAPGQKCPCKKCYIYKANLPNYKLIGSYDGSLSWVKDSDRDDSALLKHEQIHLRIEQKEAEKRAEEFRKIWVDGAKCCLWETAYYSAVKALKTEAESFFNKAYSEIEAIQKKYDEETDHGTNHEKQDEYNKEYQ